MRRTVCFRQYEVGNNCCWCSASRGRHLHFVAITFERRSLHRNPAAKGTRPAIGCEEITIWIVGREIIGGKYCVLSSKPGYVIYVHDWDATQNRDLSCRGLSVWWNVYQGLLTVAPG